MWNAMTSRVSKLCEMGFNDMVTATAWSQKNNLLAVGTNSGEVQLWDAEKVAKVRTVVGHMGRVGSIAWNNPMYFSSGSRDKNILNRDLRDGAQFTSKLVGHRQEICGLKWSFDHQQLASGGNDNRLMVWNSFSTQPMHTFSQHTAAVKALAWSPHQHGLLASGGGTADRTIRFWNTLNG
jgi:cell division cycle 20-like protein 1 (cofactor of APC complex)